MNESVKYKGVCRTALATPGHIGIAINEYHTTVSSNGNNIDTGR